MSNEKIFWTTEKRKIGDLKGYSKNPRVMSSDQEKQLKRSLKKFDYVEIAAINKDNTILAGHQRIRILKDIKSNDFEIEVRVPNRILSEKESEEYLIRSNQNTGEWDWEILEKEFNLDDLNDWGFSAEDLPNLDVEDKGIGSQPDLTKKEPKTCPQCGCEI